MKTRRGGCQLAVMDGKLIAIGGYNGDDRYLDSSEWYNIETDSWSDGPKMKQKRENFAVATVFVDSSLNV